MATTINSWIQNGSDINSIYNMLNDLVRQGKQNDETYIRKYVARDGLDPSVWTWYNSKKGSPPAPNSVSSQQQTGNYPAGTELIRNDGVRFIADGRTTYGSSYKPASGQPATRTLSDTQNLAQDIQRSLQTLSNQGYSNVDISQLPQNVDISQLPSVQGLSSAQIEQVLQNMTNQGMVVNPNKNLTELDVAEFMRRAESEVAPYYAEQLRIGREQYLRAAGYNTDQIVENEKNLEQKYGKELRTQTEQFAESGFAQSGRRTLADENLASAYQSSIGEGRRKLAYDEGNRALEFAKTYGSTGFNQINFPSPGAQPRVLPGVSSFNRAGDALPLYNISNNVLQGVIGSQQKEQATGVRELSQFYEEQERTRRTIPI